MRSVQFDSDAFLSSVYSKQLRPMNAFCAPDQLTIAKCGEAFQHKIRRQLSE
jgi:hypothetical protein